MSGIRNEFQVGIFVVVIVSLFIGSLYVMGSERQIFSDKTIYRTFFSDVKGLHNGAPIRLGGISIGRVSDIHFSMRTYDKKNIQVLLEIDREYGKYIREGIIASLATQGLLGDRFLRIDIKSESGKLLLPAAIIPSDESDGITEIGSQVVPLVDRVSNVINKIDAIATKIDDSGVANLNRSLSKIDKIVTAVESGNGIVTKLIKSKDSAKNFDELISNLNFITTKLRTDKSMIETLFNQKEGKEITTSFKETLKSLNETSKYTMLLFKKLSSSEIEGKKSIIDSLQKTANNLEVASTSLVQGRGTLGALLMDSSLYDNTVEITDTAKRNVILREAIRQSIK
jgi:phospholipid/cholesterol/gamma-HCH transport system substrate-binding protein